MEFVCYDHWDELPENCCKFCSLVGRNSVFFSQPWFKNLIENSHNGEQSIFLASVLDNNRLVALLPLENRGGGHYYSLKHLYTSLSTLLIEGSHKQEILGCLVQGLIQLPLKFLQIDPIAHDDSDMQMFQSMLESHGFRCQRNFRFYNWYHITDGESFSNYFDTRPSRVRNTVSRKQRKLKREHSYKIRLYTDEDLQQGINDYHTVYNASWKAHEQFVGFIDGLAKTFSKQGWLRLAILYINEQPAAAQFWFVAHNKASIFKLVYDQAWKKYSPGSILTAYLMQQVIDIDRVEEIDFLTGNDAYKQEWMTKRRERFRLSCYTTEPQISLASKLKLSLSDLMK
jgi:hypothetical protein